MLRIVGAVTAGLVTLLVVTAAFEYAGHALYPPPPGFDPRSLEDLSKGLAVLPIGALAFVVAGWAVASFAGAAVAALLLPRRRGPAALAIGTVMFTLVAINLTMFPHPWWMVVAGLVLPMPCAWLGARLVRGKRPPTPVVCCF